MRWIVIAGLCLICSAVVAGDLQNFTADDLVRLNRVSDPQASPDGSSVAFILRRTDMEADKGRTSIWLIETQGGEPRQMTSDDFSHAQPRWSADGQFIYFITSRSGSGQVWRLAASGGEAIQVTDIPLDVNAFAISPANDRLVVSIDVFPDCDSFECTSERLKERADSPVSAQSYDRLFMRHWDTWSDHRRSMLYSMQLDSEKGTVSADAVRLNQGVVNDVPSKPFGGPEDFGFSPDGQSVIFAARNAVGSEESWSTNFDLFKVAADGSGELENLTAENLAWDAQPMVSPDGSTLAYLAMRRPGFEADRFRIVLLDLKTGKSRVLAEDWDRSVSSMAWSADGSALYATANHLGNKPLWRIDVNSEEASLLVTNGTVSSFTVAGDQIVFARHDLSSPADLFRTNGDGSAQKRIAGFNDDRLAKLRRGEFEQFTFSGWNDETVYGYIMKPAEFDENKQYPLAFIIHGGPQGSMGNSFHYRWNPQTYAGQNYAVVWIDFHGSTGYGQAFTDSISQDWGGKPLVDLQKGLAAALDANKWIDPDRVCALGASYGGFMVNWIAGNWPDRFNCLVNHDGVFDNRMMYYSTEELWFVEWDHGAPYFQNPEQHERFNPVNFVNEWKTPMLIIHGALDYRIPYTQGIAAFTALQRKGIESQFLFFPDENHWVLKPNNSVHWHEQVNAWLHRWLVED